MGVPHFNAPAGVEYRIKLYLSRRIVLPDAENHSVVVWT